MFLLFNAVRMLVMSAIACIAFALLMPPAHSQDDLPDLDGLAQSRISRYALLIGNADYNRDGKLTATIPGDGQLRDIPNSCEDVKLLGEKFADVGWKKTNEVVVLCDQTAKQLGDLLTDFIERVRAADEQISGTKRPTFVLYFSGHGVEVNGDAYLFGAGSRPSAPLALNALRGTGLQKHLFVNQAYRLKNFYGDIGDVGSNVAVFLDACRENPLPHELRNLIASDANVGPQLSITAPRAANTPLGITQFFATSEGNFAYDSDGGQNGIYARTIKTHMAASAPVLDSMLKVRRDVVQESERMFGAEKRQKPTMGEGAHDDFCWFECLNTSLTVQPLAPAVASPVLALATQSIFAIGIQAAQPKVLKSGASTKPASPKPTKAQVDSAQSALGIADPPATRFDLFWCDGPDAAAADRRKAAEQLKAVLLASSRANGPMPGKIDPLRVRVRLLSPYTNVLRGFQRSGNDVIYDDQSERAWADYFSTLTPVKLTPIGKSQGNATTSNYVGVFFCQIAGPKSEVRNAYAQRPSAVNAEAAGLFWAAMDNAVPAVASAAKMELRDDGPDASELRFYHMEDRDAAFEMARYLRRLPTPYDIRVKFMPELAAVTKRGTVEFWFGREQGLSSRLASKFEMQ